MNHMHCLPAWNKFFLSLKMHLTVILTAAGGSTRKAMEQAAILHWATTVCVIGDVMIRTWSMVQKV